MDGFRSGSLVAEMLQAAKRIAEAIVQKAIPQIIKTHAEFPREVRKILEQVEQVDGRLVHDIGSMFGAGSRGPDAVVSNDPFYARRKSLFFDEDPVQRAAARARWRDELVALVSQGRHEQADREFGRVLGLPEYRFHGVPKDDRPQEQFAADGLVSKVAGRFGGREEVYPPEPSELRYLTWAKGALNLGPGDVVVDVGSGTGKAIDFFGMFTDAKRVYGIEIEPDFAAFANRHAAELGLHHVRTLNTDILTGCLPEDVTAVYFFEPFGSTEGNDAVGTFANNLVEVGEHRPLKVAVKSANLAERLQESGVFSLRDEMSFPYVINGEVKASSWKLFTSDLAAGP